MREPCPVKLPDSVVEVTEKIPAAEKRARNEAKVKVTYLMKPDTRHLQTHLFK